MTNGPRYFIRDHSPVFVRRFSDLMVRGGAGERAS